MIIVVDKFNGAKTTTLYVGFEDPLKVPSIQLCGGFVIPASSKRRMHDLVVRGMLSF